MSPPESPTDAVLSMHPDPYIPWILSGTKTHEFRRFRLPTSVRNLWLYTVSPVSAIQYRLVVAPYKSRDTGVLPESGAGNREFNRGSSGYQYGYEILEVWELDEPITLAEMRGTYGFRGPPRGVMYLPQRMKEAVKEERWKRVR